MNTVLSLIEISSTKAHDLGNPFVNGIGYVQCSGLDKFHVFADYVGQERWVNWWVGVLSLLAFGVAFASGLGFRSFRGVNLSQRIPPVFAAEMSGVGPVVVEP